MPILTRWFIKSGLLCLLISMMVGLLLAAQSFFHLADSIMVLVHAFLHLFMVGWVTQLIFGTAYWMFPKLSRENPRGSESLAWTCFVSLNMGLVLRAVAEPLNDLGFGRPWAGLVVVAALLQFVGAVAFVANTWGRVKVK